MQNYCFEKNQKMTLIIEFILMLYEFIKTLVPSNPDRQKSQYCNPFGIGIVTIFGYVFQRYYRTGNY